MEKNFEKLETAYNIIKTIHSVSFNISNIKKIWGMISLNGSFFFEEFENENNFPNTNLKILVFFISKTLTYSRENMGIRLRSRYDLLLEKAEKYLQKPQNYLEKQNFLIPTFSLDADIFTLLAYNDLIMLYVEEFLMELKHPNYLEKLANMEGLEDLQDLEETLEELEELEEEATRQKNRVPLNKKINFFCSLISFCYDKKFKKLTITLLIESVFLDVLEYLNITPDERDFIWEEIEAHINLLWD